MKIPYAFKKCKVCGRWLVANTVNYYKNKNRKYGIDNKCKKCISDYGKKRRDENRKINEELERKRQEKILEIKENRSNDYKVKTREQKLEFSKRHKEKNDKNRKKRKAQYNRNIKYEYRKQYYENNKEKILERNKQWREANKDKRSEYDKQYRQSPQGQAAIFNKHQRRRIREERLGTGITKEQWLEMMRFFGWKCAYSGELLNDETRTIDHIIPISKNGPNMVWNMVPMLRNLNSSKHDKDMLTWYKTQECFDRERLDKIYQWQEYAFNKWYKEEE